MKNPSLWGEDPPPLKPRPPPQLVKPPPQMVSPTLKAPLQMVKPPPSGAYQQTPRFCTKKHPNFYQFFLPKKPQSVPIVAKKKTHLHPYCTHTHKDLTQDWRGTTPQQPAAGSSQDWRNAALTGASARIGEGPPRKSQQHGPARIAGELHPQEPQPGLVRDHPTKASSRPQPGLAGNCTMKTPRYGVGVFFVQVGGFFLVKKMGGLFC